jgi:hypothetical protein
VLFESRYIYTVRPITIGGVLESRISSPYPGANHVAPPATKDEWEYCTRSPPSNFLSFSHETASFVFRYALVTRVVSASAFPFSLFKVVRVVVLYLIRYEHSTKPEPDHIG